MPACHCFLQSPWTATLSLGPSGLVPHPCTFKPADLNVAFHLLLLDVSVAPAQALPPFPSLQKSKLRHLPQQAEEEDSTKFIVLTLLSITCIIGVLVASGVIYCLRHQSHHKLKEKLSTLGTDASSDATAAYQVRTCFFLQHSLSPDT